MKTLLEVQPRHLLYMSCDPATLARDAAAFVAAGYQLKKLRVLDMFPQTSHIESLAAAGKGRRLISKNRFRLQTGLHLS